MKNNAKNHTIHFGSIPVGANHPPMIIAEMSGNHDQSLERALELVKAAAAAGAHALKIQTYTADTMTLDLHQGEFVIDDPNSLWHGESYYDLYKKAHTPWEWHRDIQKACQDLGLEFFSTPFDATAVEFLESLDVPFYKIASFENTDLPLIRTVAQTGKPVIVSTGMATFEEIKDIAETLRSNGCQDFVLLKCTSSYPADPKDSHLKTICALRDELGCFVGLSDHTLGVGAAVASVALGAAVIEKHFTLDRSQGGVDAAFSLEPHELKVLVQETERAWRALGDVHFGPTSPEKDSLKFRRSLYVVEDISQGEKLTAENLRAIRPGYGLPPKHIDDLLGQEVLRDVKKGTPLGWDMVKKPPSSK